MKKKAFIITIDTEGDNLWQHDDAFPITTRNVGFLYKFQDMANDYGLCPTWLSNWEMICDDSFVRFVHEYVDKCEIGMHLHAWNNPPIYELPKTYKSGKPYLFEYPEEIMEQKIRMITETIEDRLGIKPVSHRAGRWAINEAYFELLARYGYKYDCSITPGISWSKSKGQTKGAKGSDYRNERNRISNRGGIIEIPLNTVKMHYCHLDKDSSLSTNVKRVIKGIVGQHVFIRPGVFNIEELLRMINIEKNSDSDYVMLMLHSSELMPGGSPYFPTESSVNRLYEDIKILFDEVQSDFTGMTLQEFGETIKEGF